MSQEFKDGLFDVTRTMIAWLAGFPSRLERVARELGQTKAVIAAQAQYEVVRRAEVGDVKGAYAESLKLNGMLVDLEREALARERTPDLSMQSACDCDCYWCDERGKHCGSADCTDSPPLSPGCGGSGLVECFCAGDFCACSIKGTGACEGCPDCRDSTL